MLHRVQAPPTNNRDINVVIFVSEKEVYWEGSTRLCTALGNALAGDGYNNVNISWDFLGVTLAQCRASECDSERYQVRSDMLPLSDFFKKFYWHIAKLVMRDTVNIVMRWFEPTYASQLNGLVRGLRGSALHAVSWGFNSLLVHQQRYWRWRNFLRNRLTATNTWCTIPTNLEC